MRCELESEISSNLYKKNQKDLLFLAKQIKIKYDNLIKIREDESAAISVELKSLLNSKKIAITKGDKMKISGLTPNSYVPKESKTNKAESSKSTKIEDKLEISSEAKLKSSQIKNEAVIRQRIAEKFYDSDEVIDYVANAVLKDINSK